ncbi:competence protein CoiA family protein [Listeria valentina]|uniref:competence protein CoiA family protein n=1 Tax=Listeria valentina TaxID=2705293 RepID=UPI0014309F21|nr:competence protein CoiA family protein [Listeria valentina]
MFTAKNKQGDYFTATQANISHLKAKQGSFLCPACGEELILKCGDIKLPHFAHKQGTRCRFSSEGETRKHLLGKKELCRWLLYQGFEVKLESFLKAIHRQADLLVDGQYAVEFQCSTIPTSQLLERTNDYLSERLTPIWLLGQDIIKNKFSYAFSNFQQCFIRKSDELGYYLLFFQPEKRRIECIHHLFHAGSKYFFGERLLLPLALPLSEMKQKMSAVKGGKRKKYQPQHREIERERLCYYYAKYKSRSHFMQELYHSGFSLYHLPLQVGVQLGKQFLVHTAPVEWQFSLWIHFFDRLEVGERFAYEAIAERFRACIVPLKVLAFHEEEAEELLKEYLFYLEEKEILVEISSGNYRLMRKMKWRQTPQIFS